MSQKRKFNELEDPLDRALSYREPGQMRANLDDIGFLEFNRGSLGISAMHVHEVAQSCQEKRGIQIFRYKQVELVRIPEEALEEFRRMNRDKCASDELMPRFSPSMTKGVLAKTHFTHAQKLRKDGGRTLFNEGVIKIESPLTSEQSEDKRIIEEGVVASVYGKGLWYDKEAMLALMDADNDNAEVEMGEDAIQAQGRVEAAIKIVQANQEDGGAKQITAEAVLDTMKKHGLRSFSEQETKYLINWRLTLNPAAAQCFRTCVFANTCGHVTVSPSDYQQVAALEYRAQWTKISVMVYVYMSTWWSKVPPGTTRPSGLSTQRTKFVAPKLKVHVTQTNDILEPLGLQSV